MGETLVAGTEHGGMAYRKWGRGRPYLLITASPFGLLEFSEVGEILSISAMAVAPDLPGIGESEPMPSPTPALLCNALMSLLAAEGLDTMIVASSGIASLAAFELLDRQPSCIAGLILINPVMSAEEAEKKPPYLRKGSTSAFDVLGIGQRRSVGEIRRMLLKPESVAAGNLDAAEESLDRQGRKRLMAYYDSVDPKRFAAYMEALRRFKKPVHVLRSDHDYLWVPSLTDDIVKTVPNARMNVLSEAGHFIALESPSRLADALVEIGRRAW